MKKKRKKNTTQQSEIRKRKIALRTPPGGTECHLCVIIYRGAILFVFSPQILPFPAAENYALPLVELLCFTAHKINNSAEAQHRSPAGAQHKMPEPLLMTSSLLSHSLRTDARGQSAVMGRRTCTSAPSLLSRHKSVSH